VTKVTEGEQDPAKKKMSIFQIPQNGSEKDSLNPRKVEEDAEKCGKGVQRNADKKNAARGDVQDEGGAMEVEETNNGEAAECKLCSRRSGVDL